MQVYAGIEFLLKPATCCQVVFLKVLKHWETNCPKNHRESRKENKEIALRYEMPFISTSAFETKIEHVCAVAIPKFMFWRVYVRATRQLTENPSFRLVVSSCQSHTQKFINLILDELDPWNSSFLQGSNWSLTLWPFISRSVAGSHPSLRSAKGGWGCGNGNSNEIQRHNSENFRSSTKASSNCKLIVFWRRYERVTASVEKSREAMRQTLNQ